MPEQKGDAINQEAEGMSKDTQALVLELGVVENIPPLFRGEVLIPPDLQEFLVGSTTAILKRFVVWNSTGIDPETGQMGIFERRPDQPDLVLLPLRSAPIAARGLIALAEKYALPLPQMLPVEGIGREVYSSYERTHKYYADILKNDPAHFDRLKEEDVALYGEDESFLNWIERVTVMLDPDEGFPFGNLTFDERGYPEIACDNDMVGGYYRYMKRQIADASDTNPVHRTLEKIRHSKPYQDALLENRKAVIELIDDVEATGETNRTHAYTIIREGLGEMVSFDPDKSQFIMPQSGEWIREMLKFSLEDAAITKKEASFLEQVFRGAARRKQNTGSEQISSEDLRLESPDSIESYAEEFDGDILGPLLQSSGLNSKQELLEGLSTLSGAVQKALADLVLSREENILEDLKK